MPRNGCSCRPLLRFQSQELLKPWKRCHHIAAEKKSCYLLSCLGCFCFFGNFPFLMGIFPLACLWSKTSRTRYNSKLSLSSLQVHCLWRKFISSPPRRSLAKWCNFMICHAISIGGWAAGVILSHSSLRITSLTTSCASEMAEVLASKLATCVTLCPPCSKKMNKF